jgi:hypothetical protein
VEFTGAEQSGGAELAAPVEKAAQVLWRRVRRVRALEKDAAAWEAWWIGRKTGCHALARRRCQSGERSHDREGEWWRAPSPRRRGGAWLRRAVAESYRGAAVR